MATSLKGVTTYIEELLGMTREEFNACIMATQKEMAWLKGKSGPDRQRFLSKIRGHDVIREAQQIARNFERNFKSVVEIAMSAVSDDEVTQEQIDQALVEATDTAADAKTAINEQKQAAGDLEQATEAMAGAKVRSDAHSALLSSLSSAEARHKELQGALKKAEEAVVALPEPGGLEGLQAALVELEGESQGYDSRVKEATAEVKETSGTLMVAVAALKVSSDDWQRMELLGPDSPCDACGQSMDPEVHKEHMDKLKLTIVGEREELRGRKEFAEEAETSLKDWNTKRVAHTKAVDVAKAAATTEEQAVAMRLLKKQEVEMSAQALDMDATPTLESAREALGASTYDPTQFEDLTKRHKEASEALLSVIDLAIAANKESSSASFRHTRLVDAKTTQESAKKKIAKAQADTAMYGAVDDVFSGLRNSLNESLRPMLSAIATEIVAETTGGRFDTLELDESYTPQLYADGVQIPVISGGEEDIVSLALRIAVGQLIASNSGSPIGMLVMDEPFGSLDEERQRLVMDMLAKLCESRFNQIIVITHTMGIRDSADHIIELCAPESMVVEMEVVVA